MNRTRPAAKWIGGRGSASSLRLLLICATLGANTLRLPAAESGASKPAGMIQLFILSGQSQMVGYGESSKLTGEYTGENPRVLMFEEGKWQPLKPFKSIDPSLTDRLGMTGYSFGPEIAFGRAMAEAWPDRTIGIVKQAVSATAIAAWHPRWTAEMVEGTPDAKKGALYPVLMDKVRQAREAAECEVRGFLWMQGEADMKKEETANGYLQSLTTLVSAIRKDTGVADLPLLMGSYRFGDTPDDLTGVDVTKVSGKGNRPYAGVVMKAQFDAQTSLWPARIVPLRNLHTHPTGGHFDTEGQLQLGNLFAGRYLELAKDMKEGKKPADCCPAED